MSREVIVFIGPPGAGKGTQAELLTQRVGGVHLSSGAILRDHASSRVLGEMRQGELVREPEVDELLAQALEGAPQDKPWILDGFVRLAQDEVWLEESLATLGRHIDRIILLDISEEESERRVSQRGRSDDAVEALKERWDEYRHQTIPVIAGLEERGLLQKVNGVGSVAAVADQVAEVLV